MPKICEICKQPFPDNLTSCPNCDVIDVFESAPTATLPPIKPSPADSQDVSLGGEAALTEPLPVPPAAQAGKGSGVKKGGDQPSTKVQGPLPPVGANVGPKGGGAALASPLMAKALEGTGQGPAVGVPPTGKATMVAPQVGKATMVAPQVGKATMVAPQTSKPTMVAPPDQAPLDAPGATPDPKKTMMPQGGGKATMLSKTGNPTMMSPPGEAPLDLPQQAGAPVSPKKTMMPQGASKPTMIAKAPQQTVLAPDGTAPLDLPEGAKGSPQKKTMLPQGVNKPTMIAKAPQPTVLAPEGTEPLEPPTLNDPKKTMLPKAPQPTMLAKAGQPTKLAPEGTDPFDLPGGMPGAKKTMLPKAPQPTVLAPEDSAPLDYPEGMMPGGGPGSKLSAKPTVLTKPPQPTVLAGDAPPLDYPDGMSPPDQQSAKKTMLPKGAAMPTTLAPPEEASPLDLPGAKKTMLPKGAATPTTLAPPEEATPLALPGTGDIAESVELSGMSSAATASLSGEMAREQLEGGGGLIGDGAVVPSGPPVKPHYKRRWLGGMILGLLLAAGSLTGLWFFKNESPVKDWLAAIDLGPYHVSSDKPLEEAKMALAAGDFEQVLKLLEKKPEDTPEHATVRAEARWLRYLQNKNGDRSKMSKTDGEVVDALDELNKAKDDPKNPLRANATLIVAHIEEYLGTPADARKLYEDGAGKHSQHKGLFEAGKDRLESLGKDQKAPAPKDDGKKDDKKDDAKKDGGQARATFTEAELLELLALVLTAQQGSGPGGAPTEEAGQKFWEAYNAAKKNDYKKAIDSLKEAQKLHEKYRFQRLRKAQNPYSDPTEEIFLKASADLLVYWEIRDKLNAKGYDLANGVGPVMDKLIAGQIDPAKVLGEIAKALGCEPNQAAVLAALDKLKMDLALVKLVKTALADGKYLGETKVDDAKPEELEKGTKDLIADAKTKQKIAERVEKAGIKDQPDTDLAVKTVIEQRDDLQDTFDKVATKLEKAKYIEPKPDKAKLLAGVDLAIESALSPLVAALGRAMNSAAQAASTAATAAAPGLDPAKEIASLKTQNEILAERLRLVRTPREMLDFWMPLLENKESKDVKQVAEQAGRDARRVLDDKGADAQMKAAAKTVLGMANRLDGKYDDARTDIADALKTAKAGNESWRRYATNTQRELNNPSAYYLPRADELLAVNNLAGALDVLNAGVAAFPKDGRCLALRSQVKLEQARAQVKRQLTLKDLGEASKDATDAIALGATGEGNYAMGRIYEDVGDRGNAEKSYRQALAANPANDRAGARYRVALGRILLKLTPLPGQGPIAPPAERAPVEPKVGKLFQSGKGDLQTFLALVLTGVIAEDDDMPEVDEIIKLADQAIRSGNYEGYLVKAGALARKGQWTEALKVYSEGLQYLVRPEYADGLRALVMNHPAFNLPDPLRQPDPLKAEKFFGAGLRLYFAGQYGEAEKQFMEAYRNQGQDARILYYLGLARLPQQGKRSSAIEMFKMASVLEQQNKPSPATVNASLERVQGQLRQTLNSYRP